MKMRHLILSLLSPVFMILAFICWINESRLLMNLALAAAICSDILMIFLSQKF